MFKGINLLYLKKISRRKLSRYSNYKVLNIRLLISNNVVQLKFKIILSVSRISYLILRLNDFT